jgi:hypothetical protein
MPGTHISPRSSLFRSRLIRNCIENLESRLHLSVAQNAAGWTVVTPSPDTLTIYVSPTGNDSNNGTSASTPVKTLNHAASLVRTGYSDWILLQSGTTFNDSFTNWFKSGLSPQQPMLISSYGTGARPIIAVGTNHGGFVTNQGENVSNVDIIGIQFYANYRDPNNPDFSTTEAGGGVGFQDYSPGGNILIENCAFSYFRNNLDIEAQGGPQSNIELRRSTSSYSWSTISHSQGLYAYGVNDLTIDQDVFDHNGWNALVPGATQQGYNHNVYYSFSCTNVTVEDCTLSNASFAGIMARSGGNIIDNLFLQNPIALAYGQANGADSTPGGVTGEITGNVIVGDRSLGSTPYGQGFDIGNTNGVLVSNNIFTQDSQHSKYAIQLDPATATENPGVVVGENNLTIEDNITNGFYAGIGIDGRFQPGGTGMYAFNNVTIKDNTFLNGSNHLVRQDGAINSAEETLQGNEYYDSGVTSANWFMLQSTDISTVQWKSVDEPTALILSSMPGYENANVSTATYDQSLGGPGTFDDFMVNADQMSAAHYQPQYLAEAMIDYIRAGFALSAAPTAAVAPTAVSTPANVLASATGTKAYTFTVTYADAFAMNTSSMNSSNILVTGPSSFSQMASFVSVSAPFTNSSGLQAVTATYKFTPPNGSWTTADNGTYTVALRAGQVSDVNGTNALGATLGTFIAALSTPTATASAASLTNTQLGQSTYTFTVTYSSASAISVASLASQTVDVTGPNGYNQVAVLTGKSATGNTQTITATYIITPPGGAWAASAAGTYTITASAGGVADIYGNPLAAGQLTTFAANFVAVVVPPPPVFPSASISGYVYNDNNDNGVMDPGESPLGGVIVYADLNHDGQLDPGDPSSITDSNGHYVISWLPAGQYTIREIVPTGYATTGATSATVTLANGETATLINFGDELDQLLQGGGGGVNGTPPVNTTPGNTLPVYSFF